MFKFSDKIELLEKTEKPVDLIDSEILNKEPSPLYLEVFSAELRDHTLGTDAVIVRPKNNYKKAVKNVWDVDIKHTGPGYFDHEGNFILDRPVKTTNSWFIKHMNEVKGPFSDKELEEELKKPINNVFIKRDFDKGFVNLKSLLEIFPDIPTVQNPKDLNKFFSENQIIEKNSETEKSDFFEESTTITKSSRLINFIRTHNISASVGYIIKIITNKKKQHAVDLVQRITGLDKSINSTFIDLIIESAGKQILLDVDKDGFTINSSDIRRK